MDLDNIYRRLLDLSIQLNRLLFDIKEHGDQLQLGGDFLDPSYIGLFGPSWSELSPYGWIAGGEGGSVGPATFFFTDGQKRDYLSRASQRARGATRNQLQWRSIRLNGKTASAGAGLEIYTAAYSLEKLRRRLRDLRQGHWLRMRVDRISQQWKSVSWPILQKLWQ